MKLLFMGTSEFAVRILEVLHSSKHEIRCVITTPPTKVGRGRDLKVSPVGVFGEKLRLPIFWPSSLKNSNAQKEITGCKADAIVVASYGKILPEAILSCCKYGCINVHPSNLPRWRGAAPIERTILAGDKTTAVCIMKMDAGIDTGDVFLSEEVRVPEKITAPELRDQLASVGGKLLLKVLDNIDSIKPKKQSEEGACYAKKLKKEEGLIDWNKSAEKIERMTRAFDPWPGCFFEYKGERIRLLKAEVAKSNEKCIPGKVLDNQLSICCGKGIIKPTMLQRSGKKPLSTKDFLNGFAIKQGILL